MARPAKSLLQRCQERSFRPRHHAPLLASAPDLPCPELAELQRQARDAETEDGLRAIAREFTRTLASLTPEQLQLLLPTETPAAATEPSEQVSLAPQPVRSERGAAFLATVYAALAELPGRFPTQLSAPEEIQAELIRRAAERLAEIDQRVAEDGLTVPGSHGQLRPHPLLSFESGLRRELTGSLHQLEFGVKNRARLADEKRRLNPLLVRLGWEEEGEGG